MSLVALHPTTTTRLDLGGRWSRLLDGTQIDYVSVPGSYAPVGSCTLERFFDCGWTGRQRVRLVLEGVLASATITLNGQVLGRAGSWAIYDFAVPPGLLRAQGNHLQLEVIDLLEAFGPVPGRRWDGGLIRPIYLEWLPETALRGILFRAGLSADLTTAHSSVQVDLDGPGSPAVGITVHEAASGALVASGTATAGQPFTFTVERPALWSPEHPALYTIAALLPTQPGQAIVEEVGYRRITSNGADVFLNGRRLLLKGVCRHEFTHAHGYCPPEPAVRRELARIKHAGFNYIRLVHSPQDGMVCRIAAQLGLLVSEEPGTCWHDLANDQIAAPAVECLRRTILRDRNVPSILAWFIYNECNPNIAYAVRIAAMCRELDPDCCLSMADCSGQDQMLIDMAKAADLTFFGINVYATRKSFIERMRVLTGRPLVITEWSGFLGQGNARQLTDFCDLFVRHSRLDEPQRLIGGSIWVWADYEEHSRPSPASIQGWTVEGLVHADGRPKPDLQILSQMCFDMDHPAVRERPPVEVLAQAPRRPENWLPVQLGPVVADQEALVARADQARRIRDMDNWQTVPGDHDGYAFTPPWPRLGAQLIDGIEFQCSDVQVPGYGLLLGRERPTVTIPVGRRVRAVAVLGQVFIGGGYPGPAPAIWATTEPARTRGAPAAHYQFTFASGTIDQPLRHGIEVLRHNDICRWWTPMPRGAALRPALRSVIDSRYEVLRLDLWERAFTSDVLSSITWTLNDPEALLLICGISVLEG